MGSGEHRYSIADAQEFVRRGLVTQREVDLLIGKQENMTITQSHKPPLTRKAKEPNKTEAEYGRILEAMKLRGEIIEYRYEGITLKWADMRYTPDWFVIVEEHLDCEKEFQRMLFIEVKGAHIWDRDTVRFKGARAHWPMFAFEMHQKKGGQWSRIL